MSDSIDRAASETAAVESDTGQFAMVPVWLLDAGVSAGALHVYVMLAKRADHASNTAWPSRKRLAIECRCSLDTIDRRLAELRCLGAVEWEHRCGDDGNLTSNLYRLARVRGGSRTSAARGGRVDAARGSRTSAAENQNQCELEPDEPENARGDSTSAVLAVPEVDYFEQFWAAYPRKVGKPQARRAFTAALKRADIHSIAAGLRVWRTYWETRGEPQFIPHPSTWLNRDGWVDEPPPLHTPSTTSRAARNLARLAVLDEVGP